MRDHINDPMPTTEEQLAHLRELLENSAGHDREIIRPITPVGTTVDPETGRRFVKHGPGPLTVVTFYIAHLPGT